MPDEIYSIPVSSPLNYVTNVYVYDSTGSYLTRPLSNYEYHQTIEMAVKLKAAGVQHETIVPPGMNHSFAGKTPDQTRAANLKALDATFSFID